MSMLLVPLTAPAGSDVAFFRFRVLFCASTSIILINRYFYPSSYSSLWQASCGVGGWRACFACCVLLSDASSPGVGHSWRPQEDDGRQGSKVPQSRLGDKSLGIIEVCPQIGTAVLKGIISNSRNVEPGYHTRREGARKKKTWTVTGFFSLDRGGLLLLLLETSA